MTTVYMSHWLSIFSIQEKVALAKLNMERCSLALTTDRSSILS